MLDKESKETVTLSDVASIEALILRRVRQSVRTEGIDFYDVLQPIMRPKRSLSSHYVGLESSFGWVPANPRHSPNKIASRVLYVSRCADPQQTGIPAARGQRDLYQAITNSDQRDVFLVGERGSGKTLVWNKLVNLRLEMLHSQNFTYFRVDVAKLHTHNDTTLGRKGDPANYMNLAEYMALHAFFVTFEHCADSPIDPALVRFRADISHNEGALISPFREYLLRDDLTGHELEAAWSAIRMAHRKRKAKDPKKPDQDLYSFLNICQDGDRVSRPVLMRLFEKFLMFISAGTGTVAGITFGPAKTILVVDGIDNLRTDEYQLKAKWTAGKPSRFWYQSYVEELGRLLRKGGIAEHAWKLVCGLRFDTYEDLQNRDKVETHGDRSLTWSEPIYVCPPDLNLLVAQKSSAVRSNPSTARFTLPLEEDDRRALLVDSTPIDELLWRFEHFVESLLAQHRARLERVGVVAPTVGDVLAIVYNNNIRSFSRNCVRGVASVAEYVAQIKCATRDERDAAFRGASGLYFEASVLGGNQYFVDNRDEKAKGRWCPNLFEFERTDSRSRWDGLILLRILQALPTEDMPDAAPSANGVKTTVGHMGYTEYLIETAMHFALDFGLIRIRSYENNGERVPTYETTRKGAYIGTLPLEDVAVLYLMGTGTALSGIPRDGMLIKKRQSDGWLHATRGARMFWGAALKTGVELLRHIVSADARDMALLRKHGLNTANWEIHPNTIAKLVRELAEHTYSAMTGPDVPSANACRKALVGWETSLNIEVVFDPRKFSQP